MAFARSGWSPAGGQSLKGSAPQIWTYTTTDAKTVVDGAGYFNSVSDDVTVGDLIYSYASTGGTATATLHIVLSNASGVVDVSDGTAIAVSDSD
jgi:hypothetical protein|tara:strand:+ start:1024 stop:1305 length:282 start_codon:yes stop_codon:yes gene_type:complete